MEIEAGMVFALETYCPARDGRSAARIEEEVLVTSEGNEILTSATAVVLTGLLLAEGVTIVNRGGLVSAHLFIGVVLIPPVLL